MIGRPSWRARTRTLRFRVSAVAVLAVLLVLGVAGVGIVLAQRAALVGALDENLDHQADVVATRLRQGEGFTRADLTSDDMAVLVSGPGGDSLAGAPGLIDRLFRYGPTPDLRGAEAATVPLPGPGGGARLITRTVGASSVWVAASTDDIRDSTAVLASSLLIAVPLIAAALAALLWWLVGRVLRPVEQLRAQADSITAHRLDLRVPVPRTGDEVAALARTMNEMLDRLAGSADRQRRFIADAAHELRSPLARMRAELEVDRAHPESADPGTTQQSLLAEAAGLQQLVDDLLLLARGDAGALELAHAGPVDVDDVVQDVVAALGPHTGRQIDTRGVTPVQVRGDAAQLRRAVANLLDNALRHSAARVVVTLAERDGTAELAVADDGPGIPAADRERVFERFTRLDSARSAGEGGAGLGLPIARDIAERHGGGLRAEEVLGGARFVLTLPVDLSGWPRPDDARVRSRTIG